MENLLKYPSSCMVGKAVPKATFYRMVEMSKSMKQHMQDDLVGITWLYKVAPTTMQVQASETMREIEVFLADLKTSDCGLDLFRYIDSNIMQYVVFILRYGEQYRFLINYKDWADASHTRFNITQTFTSDWLTAAQLSLPITGTELPVIYEGFVRHIAGDKLSGGKGLHDDVLTFQEQQAIEKRIAILQEQRRKETQPRRKFELHQQIVELEKRLNS